MTIEKFKKICAAAMAVVAERGQNFYGWVNPPELADNGRITLTSGWGDEEKTEEVSVKQALDIYKDKLDGGYGERFIMSLGTISALIQNGYSVRFIQFQAEKGVPFDASGWTVMVIETMPIFHISPDDLRLEDVADVVEILPDNQAPEVNWKNTNKVGEFKALLAGSLEPGLDLVKIAQEASK